MKLYTIFALVLLALTVLSAAASAVPVTIDRVEIDDIEITPGQVNRLDLERNTEYDVEVRLTPTNDVNDLELRVFVSGFEYNDIDSITDTTRTFDADANVSYVKRLKIKFTDEVDEDDYKLRLLVSDRNGDELVQNYNIKVDVPRHELKIEDAIFFPTRVTAGDAVLSVVRIENKGEKDEKDVRVMIEVPALGISGVDYIDEIEDGDEEETEEIYLRIPKCTEPGQYPVKINLRFNQQHSSITASSMLTIMENEACNAPAEVEYKKVQVVLPEINNEETKTEDVSVSPVEESKEEEGSTLSGLRSILEITLLVLVGLLIIVGLVIGFSKLSEKDDEL